MRVSSREFLDGRNRAITLMGMSGVGKTTLAHKLPRSRWFHYSGDYRIGSRYLSEPIIDNLKEKAMSVPFLRDLLMNDSIYIGNNLSFSNLSLISTFLGKLGDPARGGLPLDEFRRRQHLHRQAEIAAMHDISQFKEKARRIYGYPHFINDAGGSICELDDPPVIRHLAAHTIIFYIEADENLEQTLIERALADPKPIYYQDSFLDSHLDEYLAENGLEEVEEMDPDAFVQWIFPKCIRHRRPLYKAIADEHGYTLSAHAIDDVRSEQDVIELLAQTLESGA